MKTIKIIFMATALMFSITFFAGEMRPGSGVSANAQIGRDIKRLGKTAYKGGRYVTVRVYRGGKWVSKRVWQSGKWVWRGGKRVFVRTKQRIP